MDRRCSNCYGDKPLESFSNSKYVKGGLSYYCKQCDHERYMGRREHVIKAVRLRREENPEAYTEYQRKYREEHKEELREYQRKYRANLRSGAQRGIPSKLPDV